VTVLDRDAQATLAALRRATPFLRRSLARHAGLRFTPQLRFLIDESVATGFRVERLLADQAVRGDRGSDDPADDEGREDR
jgi:ribosome-binding factor A